MAESLHNGSYNSTSLGYSLIGINKNTSLPEQWTLPTEWNIEKREDFEVKNTHPQKKNNHKKKKTLNAHITALRMHKKKKIL